MTILQELLHLRRQRPEAVDQLRPEALDLGVVLERREAAVEAEAELQIRDVILRDHHRRAERDGGRPLPPRRGSSMPALSAVTASSSICW